MSASAADRPNIVLLLADDLGWDDVGYHGSQILTPHIDALGASGAILEQFYVMPSCTPTRASLLTGRYPMRYGLQVSVIKPQHRYGLPLTEKLLPQCLQEAGYQTAIVGKWHLGLHKPAYLPTNRGFDHQYGCYNGMIDYVRHTVNDELDWDTELIDPQCLPEPAPDDVGHDWSRGETPNYEKGYATDLIRDEAMRVIRERDQERPLFLYVPFTAPHTPLQAKDLDLGPYEDMDMSTPRIFDDESPEAHALRQKRRRFYAALVSNMDAAIGGIVETIRQEGIEQDTLVLFMSDNGASYQGGCNDPLRGQKMSLYEGGVRVPAAMAFSGRITPGTVVDQPLHVVDLYPTLAALAGVSLRQSNPLDGQDVWPCVASGSTVPDREILLNARKGRSSALRVGDWKLVRDGRLGPIRKMTAEEESVYELFNLKEDPSEKLNRAGECPEQLAALSVRLDDYTAQAVRPLYDEYPLERDATPRVWGPHWWEQAWT
jgi:arylsulfatase A-like enzyme